MELEIFRAVLKYTENYRSGQHFHNPHTHIGEYIWDFYQYGSKFQISNLISIFGIIKHNMDKFVYFLDFLRKLDNKLCFTISSCITWDTVTWSWSWRGGCPPSSCTGWPPCSSPRWARGCGRAWPGDKDSPAPGSGHPENCGIKAGVMQPTNFISLL